MEFRTRKLTLLILSAILLVQCLLNLRVTIDHMAFLLGVIQSRTIEELRSLPRLRHIPNIEPGREVTVPLAGGILGRKLGGCSGAIKFRISATGSPELPLSASYRLQADILGRDVFFAIAAITLLFLCGRLAKRPVAARWIIVPVFLLDIFYLLFSILNISDMAS